MFLVKENRIKNKTKTIIYSKKNMSLSFETQMQVEAWRSLYSQFTQKDHPWAKFLSSPQRPP